MIRLQVNNRKHSQLENAYIWLGLNTKMDAILFSYVHTICSMEHS